MADFYCLLSFACTTETPRQIHALQLLHDDNKPYYTHNFCVEDSLPLRRVLSTGYRQGWVISGELVASEVQDRDSSQTRAKQLWREKNAVGPVGSLAPGVSVGKSSPSQLCCTEKLTQIGGPQPRGTRSAAAPPKMKVRPQGARRSAQAHTTDAPI